MNQVTLIGRLTRDPELKFLPNSGKGVCNFSLAVQRPFANKEGQREADFFNIQVWGKQAESCANYLAKGRLVAISGRIQNRKYQTQDGENRVVTEIVAERVEFLEWGDKKSSSQASEPNGFEAVDGDDIPF